MGTIPQTRRNTATGAVSWRALAPVAALALFLFPLPAAQPNTDVREIVRRSLQFDTLFEMFDFVPPRDYLCLEEYAGHSMDANGQPGPAVFADTYEVIRLYDETFERLIRRNGRELSPDKARAEQARFDTAVGKRAHETPEARAKRLNAERKSQAERDVCRDEFLRTFDFQMAGTEVIGGRPAWVVEVNPLPHTAPHCADLRTFTRFRFKVWIDQTESRWARFEGDNIAPVAFGIILARAPAGGLHFTFEQTRYGDGAWLHSRDQYKINARMLLAHFPLEMTVTYTGCRKFHADSRIVSADDQ